MCEHPEEDSHLSHYDAEKILALARQATVASETQTALSELEDFISKMRVDISEPPC